MTNNETFVRITNKDIYDKLLEIEDHQKNTNGKVKLNRWIGTTALSLAILSLGYGFRLLI